METQIYHGYTDFSVEEFKYDYTIEDLVNALKNDGVISEEKVIDDIEKLNELLKHADLYEYILQKKQQQPTDRLIALKEAFDNSKEEHDLKKLNRALLEEYYLKGTTKSIDHILKGSEFIKEDFPNISPMLYCNQLKMQGITPNTIIEAKYEAELPLATEKEAIIWLNNLLDDEDLYDKLLFPPDFKENEFSDKESIITLCNRLKEDGFITKDASNDINSLNKVLLNPRLYKRIEAEKIDDNEIKFLYREYKFSGDEEDLKFLNRICLKKLYMVEAPYSVSFSYQIKRELRHLKSFYEYTDKNKAVLRFLNKRILVKYFSLPEIDNSDFWLQYIFFDAHYLKTLDDTFIKKTKEFLQKDLEHYKKAISKSIDNIEVTNMKHKEIKLKATISNFYMKLLKTILDLLITNEVLDIPYIYINRKDVRERDITDKLIEHSLSDAPVLIVGESGIGKTGIAKTIHDMSQRRDKKFIRINCAALQESTIESELFGHIKGSYTGAVKNRNGLIYEANGGTVFLDELAKMPLYLQAKLLKVLEDNKIRPLGVDNDIDIDVRFIAAVQPVNLESKEGNFYILEDLKYRFGIHSRITLPSLNERFATLHDNEKMIILNSALFQALKSSRIEKTLDFYGFRKCYPVFTYKAKRIIFNHKYEGNFRELVDCIIEAIFNAIKRITIDQDNYKLLNKNNKLYIKEEDLKFLRKQSVTYKSNNNLENNLLKLNEWLYVDKEKLLNNPISKIIEVGKQSEKLVVNYWVNNGQNKVANLKLQLKHELGDDYTNGFYQRISRYIKDIKKDE